MQELITALQTAPLFPKLCLLFWLVVLPGAAAIYAAWESRCID